MNVRNALDPRCSAFLLRGWLLFLAPVGVGGAAVALRLELGLNVSCSAPRGLYRAVASAPARGALVVACLPAEVTVCGRARGYVGPGDCSGRTQAVLKRVGAVPGDVLELDDLSVMVNGVRILARPIEAPDSSGRVLPHAAFGSHVVADDEVRLFGSSPARSSYFGPVSAASCAGVVRPVLRAA